MSQGFADRPKQLRKQRDLSQAQLAYLADFHVSQIGRYDRGESHSSADALQRVADALGVSTDYLIEGTSDEAAKALREPRFPPAIPGGRRLPDRDKEIVLEAFLTKRQPQTQAAR